MRTRTPIDHVNQSLTLGWDPKLCVSQKLPVTPKLLVCEPCFDQQGPRHSPELQPSRCSLCSASLWVPHNALLRHRNTATLRSPPSFFFSLYLICKLLGPTFRSHRSKALLSPRYGTRNAKRFLHLQRFWFCIISSKDFKKGLQTESPMSIYSVDELIYWVLQPEQVTVECPECASSLALLRVLCRCSILLEMQPWLMQIWRKICLYARCLKHKFRLIMHFWKDR